MPALHKFTTLIITLLFVAIVSAQETIDSADIVDLSQQPTYRNVRVTHYFSPLESEFSTWYSGKIGSTAGSLAYCRLNPSERGFFEQVKCQGSGVGSDGKVYHYTSIATIKSDSIPIQGFTRGKTFIGTDPLAHRTIAADPALLRKSVYISFDNYAKTPAQKECAQRWNGCYIVEDRGSAIRGNHIDLYVGVGSQSLQEVRCLPENADVWITSCQPGVVEGVPTVDVRGEPSEEVVKPIAPLSTAITGTYYANPSLSVPLYLIDDYKTIKEQSNLLLSSCSNNNVETCLNENLALINSPNKRLFWKKGSCGNEGEKGILNDFAEQIEDCYENLDSNCICKIKPPEKNKENYVVEFKRIREETVKTQIKVGPEIYKTKNFFPRITKSISEGSDSDTINIFLGYENNLLSSIEQEYFGGTFWERLVDIGPNINYDVPDKTIKIYKRSLSQLEFVHPQIEEFNEIRECSSKKQKFRFCVTNQLNGNEYKFALDFTSTKPPIVKNIQAFDYKHGAKSILIKFDKSNADNYKIYWTDSVNKNYLEQTPRENLDSRIGIIELNPSSAVLLDEEITPDSHPPLQAETLYIVKNYYYVYLLPVPENFIPNGKQYSIAVTGINQHGEIDNIEQKFNIVTASST